MITLQVQGFDKVKNMFAEVGFALSPGQIRQILDEPGRTLVSEIKKEVGYQGEIGDDFKKDLAVQRDRRSKAEAIIVGPRFRPYVIRGKEKKVALIAQHITEGFRQTDRYTKRGMRRGRVRDRYDNPVSAAFTKNYGKILGLVNQGMIKKVGQIKRKYGA